MKNLKLTLGLLALTTAFVACDNKKEKEAQKLIGEYTTYVDSINSLDKEESAKEWNTIQTAQENKKIQAESAVTVVENKTAAQQEIDDATVKFETYKMEVEKSQAQMHKEQLRKSLFKDNLVGEDLTFAWVNKDNILNVYESFVETVQNNKDSYSREDWDEIKLLYEALDTRKNTVEKEGLSSSDNLKIAALKVKFAPMYSVNRVGAKAEENSEAKE
ncbi:MAG: hypothetical protein R2790_03890 [Flavobacterium haoranii]